MQAVRPCLEFFIGKAGAVPAVHQPLLGQAAQGEAMMQLEQIEILAEQFIGQGVAQWTTTQKTIYKLLVDFGLQVAKRADQIAEQERSHAHSL